MFKKEWSAPQLISLNNNAITSGNMASGVEYLQTCDGSLLTRTLAFGEGDICYPQMGIFGYSGMYDCADLTATGIISFDVNYFIVTLPAHPNFCS